MLRILIVDDEETIRNGLSHLITSFQMELAILEPVSDGLKALEVIKNFHPEIILMDINMPKLNGLDAIKQIKAFDKNCIIIIISGYGQFEYAQKAIDMGVFNYLLKPIDYRNFKEILVRAMNEYTKRISMVECTKDIICEDLSTQVINYINSNFTNEITIAQLSNIFHTSQSNLTKIIKNKTSQSFTDYVNHLRIDYAKSLLLNKDLNYTISEISEKCGYASIHYFSKVFKSHTGISPTRFR